MSHVRIAQSAAAGRSPQRRWQIALAAWVSGGVLAAAALPAHALFSDDEARRAILDLRSRLETQRQAVEATERHLQATERQLQELQAGSDSARRGVLDVVNQIEAVRRELATLRGQQEHLARDLADLQRQQRDALAAFDERLRALEPTKVVVDGDEFTVRPDEKAAFEEAMAVLRASDFSRAARLYGAFLARYPGSGYAPLAWYWQGNALYADRQYRAAIDSYQRLIDQWPQHPRAAEAMLAIASCQLELKDAKAARATWQALVTRYPHTEAAAAARERLARLR
ncbi:MAG: tol-pal system protein YbgF [Tepidimonas sp.]|uniref:tol-pal system protein YbgF n=1 Tax=Tepidimonas sp. TaxID=2002775 RepID=UPI00259FAAF6|nr:tol-pal system protein YbgF [Tepidimonas sp.]MDM7456871.1 tol-pal system protein YbgF [Tepidimonas sp.]